jgi:hypothetical protein
VPTIKTDVSYRDIADRMRARGGRKPSETRRMIEEAVLEKIREGQFGKDNGFLVELDSGEELKSIRPKLSAAAKSLTVTLGSETQDDERAIWVWVVAEGRRPRQPRAQSGDSESAGTSGRSRRGAASGS